MYFFTWPLPPLKYIFRGGWYVQLPPRTCLGNCFWNEIKPSCCLCWLADASIYLKKLLWLLTAWQDFYAENYSSAWDDLITLIVSDFAHAQQHGINLPVHGVVYPIVLGNKGDWSWLVSGLDWNLQRLCSNHPWNYIYIYLVTLQIAFFCSVLRKRGFLPFWTKKWL